MNRPGRSGVYPPMQPNSQSTIRPWRSPARPADPDRPDPPDPDADTIDLTVVHVDPHRDFETFYRDGYADIARALTVTLGDLDLAQEATDEAMVRAYVRWDKIGAYDNPGGWVYRVGLNWARSARRRLSRASSRSTNAASSTRRSPIPRTRRVARPRRQPARGRRVPPASRLVGRRDRRPHFASSPAR